MIPDAPDDAAAQGDACEQLVHTEGKPPRYALGPEIGKLLCEVLSIDPACVGALTIDCRPDTIISVRLTRYLTDTEGRALATLLEQYRLVRRDGDRDTKVPPDADDRGLVDITDFSIPYRKKTYRSPEASTAIVHE